MNERTAFCVKCHRQREQVAKSKLDQGNEEVAHYMQGDVASKFL